MACKFEEMMAELGQLTEKKNVQGAKGVSELKSLLAFNISTQPTQDLMDAAAKAGLTDGYKKYTKKMQNVISKHINTKVATDNKMPLRNLSNGIAEGLNMPMVYGQYIPGIDKMIKMDRFPLREEVIEALTSGLLADNPTWDESKAKKSLPDGAANGIFTMIKTTFEANGAHNTLHEYAHAGAINFMVSNPKHEYTKRMEELFEIAKSDKNIGLLVDVADVNSGYWATDVHEFIAEGLSSPVFIEKLSRINVDGLDRKSKTLMADLFSIVTKMLGLTNKDSMYAYLLDGYSAILETQGKVAEVTTKGSDPEGLVAKPGLDEGDVEIEAFSFDPKEEIGEIFLDFYEEEGRQLTSQKFSDLQNNLITAYTDMAKAVDMDLIDVNRFTNATLDTAGEVTLGNANAMRIRWNSASRLATQSEIFMHETSHIIAKGVFKSDVDLRNVTKELRDKAVKEGVDYTAFLDGIENPSDIEVEVAKRKYGYVFEGELEEFYAYVVSNESVYKAIENIKLGTELIKKIKGMDPRADGRENVTQKILNTLINAINVAWAGITGRAGKGSDVVGHLVATVARLGAEVHAKKEAEAEAQMDTDQDMWSTAKAHGAKLNDTMSDIIGKKTEWIDATATKTKAPFKKLDQTLRKVAPINAAIETGAMQYLVNTVTQDTTKLDVTGMYQVFRKSKGFVEKHTSEIRHAIQKIVDDRYTGEDAANPTVDKSTQKAVKAIIVDTDLGKVLGQDIADTKRLLDDAGYLRESMDALVADLREEYKVVAGPGMDFRSRLNQINGLAHYMIHGQTIMHNQQMNASNIVAGFDVPFETKSTRGANGEQIPARSKRDQQAERTARSKNKKLIEKVDKLTTLVALKKAGSRDKALVSELIGKDPELVTDTIKMYENYMKGLHKDAKVGTYDPVRKGYSKAEEGVIKYRLVPEAEVEGQISVNMKLTDDQFEYSTLGKDKTGAAKRMKAIQPYAIIEGTKYYMMTGRVKGTGFSEGAIGLISNTAEGITLSSLIRKNHELDGGTGALTGKAEADMRKMISQFAKDGQAPGLRLVAGTTVVPVYDHTGHVVDYRLQMTTVQKEIELDEGNELGQVLSNTFSRSTKTELTKQYNTVVVDTIIEHTGRGVAETPEDYIVIEEYTEEMRRDGIKYEKRHERWENLPDYTKDYIFKKIGEKGLPVHKDFVELMTGEKDITIGNLKVGNFDVSKKPKLKAQLTALESYSRELLGHMKRVMILLDAGVVVGNVLSNATVAAIHGIDPITYVKEMKNNWKLLNEYNELSREKAELEVLAKTGKDTSRKIAAINKQLAEHEYDKLVKDGQFTPIAEDINIDAKPDGQLYGMMQDFIDGKGKYAIQEGDSQEVIDRKNRAKAKHDKMASVINGVKNVLYIDKASKLGKLALKNTQYQDAMTRRVVENKLNKDKAKKKGVKVEDLSKEDLQETLDYVDQLLVNYGYTMNRYWNYAEKVTGLLFLRYFFGQAKALAAMTTKNPLGVILAEGGQGTTGIDIYDPFETYAKNPIDAMINRWMLDDTIPKLISPNIGDVFRL